MTSIGIGIVNYSLNIMTETLLSLSLSVFQVISAV